jgi:hydrogenase/urease accessory protein HupE
MLDGGMATNLPFIFAQVRFWIVVLVCLLTSLSAQAHPGHDGHEDGGDFTWTYEHAVRHPWASLLVVVVGGLLVWGLFRMLRQAQQPVKGDATRSPAVGTLS